MAKRAYHPPQIFTPGFLHYYSAAQASKGTPILVFPDTPQMREHHYPKHQGEFAWVIKNGEGKVIDKYSPPKKAKSKPQTPISGSWADVTKKESQRTAMEAERDRRPTSIMLDGIVTLSNGLKVEFTSSGKI